MKKSLKTTIFFSICVISGTIPTIYYIRLCPQIKAIDKFGKYRNSWIFLKSVVLAAYFKQNCALTLHRSNFDKHEQYIAYMGHQLNNYTVGLYRLKVIYMYITYVGYNQ